MRLALSLDLDNAGSSMLARIAMIAITTSSSIKVNAARLSGRWPDLEGAPGTSFLTWLD